MGLFQWTEKSANQLQRGGVIGPDERLPWPQTGLMGIQHVIAMFGSTVLIPQFLQLLMGYTAQNAGLALSPGSMLIIFLMPLIGRLVGKVDALVIGGAMANTFLAAQGFNVGKSLFEADQRDTARAILSEKVMLPLDVVVAEEFKPGAAHRIVALGDVATLRYLGNDDHGCNDFDDNFSLAINDLQAASSSRRNNSRLPSTYAIGLLISCPTAAASRPNEARPSIVTS